MRVADTSPPAVPDEGGQGRGEQLLQRHHALLAEAGAEHGVNERVGGAGEVVRLDAELEGHLLAVARHGVRPEAGAGQRHHLHRQEGHVTQQGHGRHQPQHPRRAAQVTRGPTPPPSSSPPLPHTPAPPPPPARPSGQHGLAAGLGDGADGQLRRHERAFRPRADGRPGLLRRRRPPPPAPSTNPTPTPATAPVLAAPSPPLGPGVSVVPAGPRAGHALSDAGPAALPHHADDARVEGHHDGEAEEEDGQQHDVEDERVDGPCRSIGDVAVLAQHAGHARGDGARAAQHELRPADAEGHHHHDDDEGARLAGRVAVEGVDDLEVAREGHARQRQSRRHRREVLDEPASSTGNTEKHVITWTR